MTKDSSSTRYLVIEFKTQAGSIIKFTSQLGSSNPSHSKGDKISVFYHNTTPVQAKINHFKHLWFLPIVLGIAGVFVFFIGYFMDLFLGKKVKK